MRSVLQTELKEREVYMIGSIVSQWGFLEAEIFEQTLQSFEDGEELPSVMKSNAQFSKVLKLWAKRVVSVSDGIRKPVLCKQHEKILSLSEFRQAVVHSRWEWKPDDPDTIAATRIHKQSVKRVKFSFDDLFEFSTSLGEIRYAIRYPGGLEDRAKEMIENGGYVSRQAYEFLSGRETLTSSKNTNTEK